MFSRLIRQDKTNANQDNIDEQINKIQTFVNCKIPCYLSDIAGNFLELHDKNKKISCHSSVKKWLEKIRDVISSAVTEIYNNGYSQDQSLINPLKDILAECHQHTSFLLPGSANFKKNIIAFLQNNSGANPKDPLYCRDHFIAVEQNKDCKSGEYCLKDFERMGSGVRFNGKYQAITLNDNLKDLYGFLKENLFSTIVSDNTTEALSRLFSMHTHQGGFIYSIAAFLQFDMAYNLAINDYEVYKYLLPKTSDRNFEFDFDFYPLDSGYGVCSIFSYFEEDVDNRKCILQLSTNHEITLDLSDPHKIDFDHYDFICTSLSCEIKPCTQESEQGVKEKANQYLVQLKGALDNKAALLIKPVINVAIISSMAQPLVNKLPESATKCKRKAGELHGQDNSKLFKSNKTVEIDGCKEQDMASATSPGPSSVSP